VIFYADRITGSMDRAISETNRRREKQIEYNLKHGITPRSIVKSIEDVRLSTSVADAKGIAGLVRETADEVIVPDGIDDPRLIPRLEKEMFREADALNFEKAASIRDRIEEIKLNMVRRRGSGGTQAGDRTQRRGGSR